MVVFHKYAQIAPKDEQTKRPVPIRTGLFVLIRELN